MDGIQETHINLGSRVRLRIAAMHLRQKAARRAKSHRNYTVQEVAALRGVHTNTVARWIKFGLPVIDSRRPKLILGHDLNAFIDNRTEKRKRPCRLGEIYCVGCHATRLPAARMADYEPQGPTNGRLVGICPICDRLMYQQCSTAKLAKILTLLDITITTALVHIVDSAHSVLNSEFE